jgi:hypothetical protein
MNEHQRFAMAADQVMQRIFIIAKKRHGQILATPDSGCPPRVAPFGSACFSDCRVGGL